VPSVEPREEKFVVFSFHFAANLDNSGFVGWLASHLKAEIGTGVLVVCGQNTERGGIFDYWGAPLSVADQVIAEIRNLRGERSNAQAIIPPNLSEEPRIPVKSSAGAIPNAS